MLKTKSLTELKDYTKAFTVALGCTLDDFKIKPFKGKSKSGPMISQYKDRSYLVYDLDDLYEYAEECITDPGQAMFLRPDDVADIMEFAYATTDFYDKLLPLLDDKEKQELSLLLGIHNATGEDFWHISYHHGNPDLYGKAVYAAGLTFNLEALKIELVEIFMHRGEEILCVHVDGTFKEVVLNEDSEEEKYFLIHDTEFPYDWLIAVNNPSKSFLLFIV